MKILLVDDEKQICASLKKSLESAGEFSVETINDAAAAVPAAIKWKPDVVLLDVMMPGKSGSVIARELKENETTKDIPVIFLTGIVSGAEVQSRDNMIGGEYFAAKPVDTGALIRLIKKIA